jgi:hypothetical protein
MHEAADEVAESCRIEALPFFGWKGEIVREEGYRVTQLFLGIDVQQVLSSFGKEEEGVLEMVHFRSNQQPHFKFTSLMC